MQIKFSIRVSGEIDFFNCRQFSLILIQLVLVCILTSYMIRVYATIKYVVRRLIFVDPDPSF